MQDLNPTGIKPTEYNVLVRLKKHPEKIGSVLLPGETKDRKQAMDMRGTLIAVSPLAFSYDGWEGAEAKKPQVGDEVIIAKASGFYFEGKEFGFDDGEFYRMIKDKDVVATYAEPPARAFKVATEAKRLKPVNVAQRAVSAV